MPLPSPRPPRRSAASGRSRRSSRSWSSALGLAACRYGRARSAAWRRRRVRNHAVHRRAAPAPESAPRRGRRESRRARRASRAPAGSRPERSVLRMRASIGTTRGSRSATSAAMTLLRAAPLAARRTVWRARAADGSSILASPATAARITRTSSAAEQRLQRRHGRRRADRAEQRGHLPLHEPPPSSTDSASTGMAPRRPLDEHCATHALRSVPRVAGREQGSDRRRADTPARALKPATRAVHAPRRAPTVSCSAEDCPVCTIAAGRPHAPARSRASPPAS